MSHFKFGRTKNGSWSLSVSTEASDDRQVYAEANRSLRVGVNEIATHFYEWLLDDLTEHHALEMSAYTFDHLRKIGVDFTNADRCSDFLVDGWERHKRTCRVVRGGKAIFPHRCKDRT